MFEYKNGLLKLSFTNSVWDVVWSCSFFLFMLSCICYGNFNDTNNYFYYFVFFLFVGVSSLGIIFKGNGLKKIFIPLNTIWYGLFFMLCVVSCLWAESFTSSAEPLSRLLQILAVTTCVFYYIDNDERLDIYLNTTIAASFYLIIYIFVKTPYTKWFDGFIGSVTGYNTNDVGLALSICFIISFYKAFVKGKHLMYILSAVSFLTAILTSSRKALFMCVLSIIMIVAFNYRAKNYVLRLLISICLVILSVILIYEIPQLYQSIGVRLDSMISFFMNDKNSDSSLALRETYINLAKSFFFEKPVIGHGINNFGYLNRLMGNIFTYAHNNYLEIAADLGVVGLVVYYWFYLYLLIRLIKQTLNGHKTALLYLPLILLLVIFEYGMVNYYKMQVHLVIASAFAATTVNEKAERKLG
jgi:O-antigen ligase